MGLQWIVRLVLYTFFSAIALGYSVQIIPTKEWSVIFSFRCFYNAHLLSHNCTSTRTNTNIIPLLTLQGGSNHHTIHVRGTKHWIIPLEFHQLIAKEKLLHFGCGIVQHSFDWQTLFSYFPWSRITINNALNETWLVWSPIPPIPDCSSQAKPSCNQYVFVDVMEAMQLRQRTILHRCLEIFLKVCRKLF